MTDTRDRFSMIRYRLHKFPERVTMAVAWALPHRLAMWTAVRVMAHATSGSFGNQIVPELTAMDALKRWDDPTGGDRRVGQRAA